MLDVVDHRDVGVAERCEHTRLPLETRETLWVGREGMRQNLDRDLPSEPRVARAVDLSHSTGAEQPHDLEAAEPIARL